MKLDIIKNTLFESKKYILVYLIFICISFLSMITNKNVLHPKIEILTFIFIIILGIICITYYFLNNRDENLYKVAFVIIVCFGLVCSLLIPIGSVSDEPEHFIRSEITSQGILFPHWTGDDLGLTRTYNTDGNLVTNETELGFHTIISSKFMINERGLTVFETSHDTDKINSSDYISHSAFEQNVFYGYLPQAIGILIAKLLDLNVIWMMWFARICNLLCYATLVSYAIKKTPYLKIPLLAVACIPISIFQAGSVSIDSMLFGLGILTISYFIYMCKSEKNSLTNKELIIFSGICLLFGLCKLPYLLFIFLLLLIPKENFKDSKNLKLYILLSIIIVAIISILWSKYSAPTILHSWRSKHDINTSLQILYLINHSELFFKFLSQIFNHDLPYLINGVFNFFTPHHHPLYNDKYYLITFILQIFLVLVLIAYPNTVKFNFKTKIGTLGILLLVYFGICFVQLLSWANVGKTNLGISLRYFIPLIALIPIICGINKNNLLKYEFDKYAVIFIIGFLGAMALSFATKYY